MYMFFFFIIYQERLANIGPEEFVQTFIPRDEADLRVRSIDLLLACTHSEQPTYLPSKLGYSSKYLFQEH